MQIPYKRFSVRLSGMLATPAVPFLAVAASAQTYCDNKTITELMDSATGYNVIDERNNTTATVIKGTGEADLILLQDNGVTVKGKAGHDCIIGGVGADTIKGGQGDDTIYGGGGNEILRGGPRDDILDGGVGDDLIRGGDGNDEIDGQEGDDILQGRLR